MPRHQPEAVERSDGVVRSDQELPPEDRERYWGCVKEALRDVFGKNEELADQARTRLESLEGEKEEHFNIFYHANPLEVAGDLAGQRSSEITLEQKKSYQELLKRWNLK